MSATQLVQAIRDDLRAKLSKDECKQVQIYGGAVDVKTISNKRFVCPAVMVACLGWKPVPEQRHQFDTRFAVFVLTKDAKGDEARKLAAMALAEKITRVMNWQAVGSAAPVQQVQCQNLFSGEIDQKKIALWAITWWQSLRMGPEIPADLNNLLCVTVETNEPQTADIEMTTDIDLS